MGNKIGLCTLPPQVEDVITAANRLQSVYRKKSSGHPVSKFLFVRLIYLFFFCSHFFFIPPHHLIFFPLPPFHTSTHPHVVSLNL